MENWKAIPDYPKYEVSDLGNVRNVEHGNTLRPFDRCKYGPTPQRGYLTVHLCKDGIKRYRNYSVHSLVMSAFIGPRPGGHVINHINGIRNDNRLENLEYCTQSINRKQDFVHGRQSLKGEKNTQAKLSESQVLDIVNLYNSGGYTYRSLAERFGVAFTGISNIFNGHCWSYLTGIKSKSHV